MSSLPAFGLVTSPPSASPAGIASLLDAALQALGSVSLLTLDCMAYERTNKAGTVDLAFTYYTNGTLLYRATAFVETTVSTVDAQMAAFFDADEARRAVFVRDLTSDFSRRTGQSSVLVVYATTALPLKAPYGSRAVILRSLEAGNIAPGATASASVRTSTGSLATVTAVNRGNIAWKAGQEAYGTVDIAETNYVALPTCCSGIP